MKNLGFILFACIVVTVQTSPAHSSPPSMGFLENRGQLDPAVRYYAHTPSVSVYLTDKAIMLGLHSEGPSPPVGNSAKGETLGRLVGREPEGMHGRSSRSLVTYGLSIEFEGANRLPRTEALDPLPGRYNFLLGNDPRGWHTNLESFRKIVYRDLWPGIDLVFTLTPNGLSYDTVVRPGADTGQIAFVYDGADRVTGAQGSRRIEAVDRMLLQKSTTPTRGDFQWASGVTCPTSGGCEDQNDEPQRPELLVWSTLIGGNGSESAYGMVRDPDGSILLTGSSSGSAYPTTPGASDTLYSDGVDAFVTKLAPDGSTLLWSTFIGDTCYDNGDDIAVDAVGNPVVVGVTRSDLFPTTQGAFDNTAGCTGCLGCYDVFVLKLAATGDQLIWSTFLGPSEGNLNSIAIDPSGHPIVAGEARGGFPTTPNAFDPSANGGLDAFVSILGEDGSSLLFSTYLGGGGDDVAFGIAVDALGRPCVTGSTRSGDFPVRGKGPQRSGNGSRDVFVAELDPELSTLVFSTILGGSGIDQGSHVYCDTARVLVCGYTSSNDFPVTTGAFDETYNGDFSDAFVACLKADNGWLVWNTYVGGVNLDVATDIAFDPTGAVVVKGMTHSDNFPVTANAYDGTFNGIPTDPSACSDFFLTVLSLRGDSASMSTFVGGSHVEGGRGLMLEEGGFALLAGYTASCDFPITPGAYDSIVTSNLGDVVVAKLRYERPAPPVSVTNSDRHDPGFQVMTLPNPSRQGVTFKFDVRRKGPLDVSIRDVAGRTVWASRHSVVNSGPREIFWNGTDQVGVRCRPGVYVYTVKAGPAESRGRITLLQ